MLYPASEYEGYTYLKVYAADACKANMLKILQTRIGAERVITFGSIPGQYDVYVHDDGGNSAVKMLKNLYGGKKLEDVLYGTEIPGMFMIFAGPSVPNPTEILEKKYFEELLKFGKEHFNYVLLDCAPIGAAIDAAVIAKHCDGAILVIAQGMASGRLIQNVKKQLEASGVRVLGAVLNMVKMKKNSYDGGYYGGYYGSYYGNNGEDKKET